MREMVLRESTLHKPQVELSKEERAQLNTILDLLIPADDYFPAPSSLHLLDEVLSHLPPVKTYKRLSVLDVQSLRILLSTLNCTTGGDFCRAELEEQRHALHIFELHDPAIFQALWTLANHSYYTRIAKSQSMFPIPNTPVLQTR